MSSGHSRAPDNVESTRPVHLLHQIDFLMCPVAQSASVACEHRRDTPKLSKEEMAKLLPAVPDWAANEDGTSISKAFVAKNFKAGVMHLIGRTSGYSRGRKLSTCVICSNSILYRGNGSRRGRGAPSRSASDQLQRCQGGLSCSRLEKLVVLADPGTHFVLSAQVRVSCQIAAFKQCWVCRGPA